MVYTYLLLPAGEVFSSPVPRLWGETIPGVCTRMKTEEPVVALTLDACGGKRGNGFDRELIEWLEKEKIPATLFVTGRWIEVNEEVFLNLASSPLFQIENHGMNHKPASVSGQSAYGIKGSCSIDELLEEVDKGAASIYNRTRRHPKLFRSGTNYYDDIALSIIKERGYSVVGYTIAGDGGASFSKKEIISVLLKARPGDIILCHMNHPESSTAEGLMSVIPLLQEKGFRFVKLQDYPLFSQENDKKEGEK